MSDELFSEFTAGSCVAVRWVDSCSSSEWLDPEIQDFDPVECVTFGVILSDNRTQITLGQSATSHGQVAGVMTIPKACVVSVDDMAPAPQTEGV